MTELIRRQDAELILAREMFATSLKDGCDPVSPMDFLPEARAWLSDAPTTGGWIPCSERLPEVNGRYLCANDQWGAWRVDINMWVNGHWRNQIEKPIAWMPLPEPYREDGEA